MREGVTSWILLSVVSVALVAGVACSTGPTESTEPRQIAESEPLTIDPRLAKYESLENLQGELVAKGSDTMENLVSHWARTFGGLYPDVSITIEGRGSGTAPPALVAGVSQLAPMSRRMTENEIRAFAEARGYAPTMFTVATDALALYVHRDNPLDRLTMEQVDAIFSSTLSCGHPGPITTWGDLGVEGEWATRSIRVYSRDELSGTYDYFRENALCGGEYGENVLPLQSSAALIQKVGEDESGIGYSGIGYKSPSVDTLAVARSKGEFFYDSDTSTVQASSYPLLRGLYIYVDKNPDGELDPLVAEFLEFCLSAEGQQIVLKEGFLPLAADVSRTQLDRMVTGSL